MNTSINLPKSIVYEINAVTQKSGLSKSKLVKILISKIKNFTSIEQVEGVLIEYQDRISNSDVCGYDKVHFSPDPDMVDFTKSLRFHYRISVSKFVCASFLFFWDCILKEIFENSNEIVEIFDNYEELLKVYTELIEYFKKRLNYSNNDEVKQKE